MYKKKLSEWVQVETMRSKIFRKKLFFVKGRQAHLTSSFLLIIFLSSLLGCNSMSQKETIPAFSPTTTTSTPTLQLIGNNPTITPTATYPKPSSTPIPTLPQLFRTRIIQTATLAPSSECPPPDPNTIIHLPDDPLGEPSGFEAWSKLDQTILAFLNHGGTIENLVSAYRNGKGLLNETRGNEPFSIDLTNDNVVEIVAINPASRPDRHGYSVYVFSCDEGFYKSIILQNYYGITPQIFKISIMDLNVDGIPEIILHEQRDDPRDSFTRLRVLEWDGKGFSNLLLVPTVRNFQYLNGNINALSMTYKDEFIENYSIPFTFEDINLDTTLELIITYPEELFRDGLTRGFKIIFAWDGQYLKYYRTIFTAPRYRFQAIQDADDASRFGEYDKALALYEEAIINGNLLSYSPDQKIHIDWLWLTPRPHEFEVAAEWPRLAAYAAYRIMLIDIVRGNNEEALSRYDMLQKQYPIANPGNPFAVMASSFWNAYQHTGNMTEACAAAIDYAAKHTDILNVLGDEFHSYQSQTYTAADVCPFR